MTKTVKRKDQCISQMQILHPQDSGYKGHTSDSTALLPAVDMKPYKMKAVQKNFNTLKRLNNRKIK